MAVAGTHQNFSSRANAVLRDVVRSGGRDVLAHMLSHGHHRLTIYACLRRGWLKRVAPFTYEITDIGRPMAGN